MAKSDNDRTLDAYEHGVGEYNAAAIADVTGAVKDWIDAALDYLPAGAHIMELGSAHGRDADYMESKGFAVERTDAAHSFVDYLKSRGREARLLNALTDEYGGPYDMVYANAVFVHFTHGECAEVLERCKRALAVNGLVAFSVKVGEGSGWSNQKLQDPRFFTYWQEKQLKELLQSEQLDQVYWSESASGHNAGEWFHVIAQIT